MSITDIAEASGLPLEIAETCIADLRHRGLVVQLAAYTVAYPDNDDSDDADDDEQHEHGP